MNEAQRHGDRTLRQQLQPATTTTSATENGGKIEFPTFKMNYSAKYQ